MALIFQTAQGTTRVNLTRMNVQQKLKEKNNKFSLAKKTTKEAKIMVRKNLVPEKIPDNPIVEESDVMDFEKSANSS